MGNKAAFSSLLPKMSLKIVEYGPFTCRFQRFLGIQYAKLYVTAQRLGSNPRKTRLLPKRENTQD